MQSAQNTQNAFSEEVTIFLMLGVALLPWVTLVVSELALVLYRHSVVRSMRGGTALLPVTTPPAPPLPGAEPRLVALQVQTADDSAADVAGVGNALYDEWRRATRDATKIYVAAGVAYAGVMAMAFVFRLKALTPLTLLFVAIGFAWPVVLTAILIAAPARRWQVTMVVVYWIGFFSSGWVLPIETLVALLMANVGATIVALIVRGRRIRAVAPLVGAFLMLLGVILVVALNLVAKMGTPPGGADEMSGTEVLIVLLLTLGGIAGGPLVGWLALRWLGRWYAQKRTSEQTIAMAAIWLIFAGVHSATFAYNDLRWMSIGLLAFAGFLLATAAGFRILRQRSERSPGPRLLVLRVFALGRRSRRLFDRLAARWRHIGSVQLIAGPDLASSTVEPHEFFDFLRRRLAGRFLESSQSIDSALAELDTAPDHDGRYRITDFFCRDAAWRTVFGHLAGRADVVLMDLRGFSSENCGCTYEVGELLNLVSLDRIAIVIDRSTDERFLAHTIEQASGRISASSPNSERSPMQVRVFRETGWRGLDPDRLLRLLCDTVARSRVDRLAQVS